MRKGKEKRKKHGATSRQKSERARQGLQERILYLRVMWPSYAPIFSVLNHPPFRSRPSIFVRLLPLHPTPRLLSPATPTAVVGRTLLLHTLNTARVSSLFIRSNASNHERDFAPSFVCFQFGLWSFASLFL